MCLILLEGKASSWLIFCSLFRVRSLLLLVLLTVLGARTGAALPCMTSKEVGLMLRSGYSSTSVIKELSQRHFVDTLDPDKEAALVNAGASEELLSALKSGVYRASAKDLAQARTSLLRPVGHASAQPALGPRVDLATSRTAPGLTGAARIPFAAPNALTPSLQGNLVRFDHGSLAPLPDEAVAGKKLIALYFSAHWCPPCRKFTPELVEFYNRVAPQHPEFEIIFVSYDRSAAAMQTYMSETSMPWPALAFDKIPYQDAIRKYAGSGIPCLVLVDTAGKVLSDSFAGKQYLGPQKVLADLTALLSGTTGLHVAQGR